MPVALWLTEENILSGKSLLHWNELMINEANCALKELIWGICVACVGFFVASSVHFSRPQLQLLSQQAIMQFVY